MVRHCSLCLGLMTVSMLCFSTGAFGKVDLHTQAFPAARTETYRVLDKRMRIYRVQEPEVRQEHANILIYMHGSGGKEEQGMDPLW